MKKNKRKYIALLLLFCLFCGCTKQTVAPEKETDKEDKVVKILLPYEYSEYNDEASGRDWLRKSMKEFGRMHHGLKLEFMKLEATDYADYSKKLNILMLEGNLPDIYLLSNYATQSISLKTLIDTHLIADITQDLENHEGLLPFAKNDYFYPFAIIQYTSNVSRQALRDINANELAEATYVTDSQVGAVYGDWLKIKKPRLSYPHFNTLYDYFFNEFNDFGITSGVLTINTPEVRQAIVSCSNYLNNDYFTFDSDDTINTSVSAVLRYDSPAFMRAYAYYKSNHDKQLIVPVNGNLYDLLKVGAFIRFNKGEEYAKDFLPKVADSDQYLRVTGLCVSSETPYKEEATAFIDYLLSYDRQCEMYGQMGRRVYGMNTPVNEKAFSAKLINAAYQNPNEIYTETALAQVEELKNRENSIAVLLNETQLYQRLTYELKKLIIDYGIGEMSEKKLDQELMRLQENYYIRVNE